MNRKSLLLSTTMLLTLGIFTYALAQEKVEPAKSDASTSAKSSMPIGMPPMGGGMAPNKSMMKAMMIRSVFPTSDGNIIVLVGDKLQKYDKNLNKVKEIEIDFKMDDAPAGQ